VDKRVGCRALARQPDEDGLSSGGRGVQDLDVFIRRHPRAGRITASRARRLGISVWHVPVRAQLAEHCLCHAPRRPDEVSLVLDRVQVRVRSVVDDLAEGAQAELAIVARVEHELVPADVDLPRRRLGTWFHGAEVEEALHVREEHHRLGVDQAQLVLVARDDLRIPVHRDVLERDALLHSGIGRPYSIHGSHLEIPSLLLSISRRYRAISKTTPPLLPNVKSTGQKRKQEIG